MQMKWLICTKLASCLRMRPSLKPATPSPFGSRKNSIDAVDFRDDGQRPSYMNAGTTDKLLVEIREICHRLGAQFRKAADVREMTDEDEDKRNEWKLAAAVLDRILFITFSALVVGGTVLFSITFAVVFIYWRLKETSQFTTLRKVDLSFYSSLVLQTGRSG